MSMRRILLLALTAVSVIAVIVNTIIFSSLTDKYFQSYMKESYELHVGQIVEYSKRALQGESISPELISMELESHLIDPIIRIRLYQPDGILISDVRRESPVFDEMMGRRMMRFMMGSLYDETDTYQIISDGSGKGILYITRYSSVENSYIVWRFKSSLFRNSMLAIVIAVCIAFLIGMIISKKTTRALRETMLSAQSIRLGEGPLSKKTGITEVDEIRSSLSSLHDQLKLRQKSRKAMTDSLIHQARSPLTIIKTQLEAMQDDLTSDTDAAYKTCHEQIDELTDMIENLGSIIDADRDTEAANWERIDAGRHISRILSALKAQFDKKGIELSYGKDSRVSIVTDPNKFDRIIYNLLNNAYKYTSSGGRVIIVLSVSDKWIELSVEDTGSGMSLKTIERIFDAYYRGPESSSIPGDGLGLYIVKQDLDLIKGEISVSSEPGYGSRFIIRFPRDPDAD